MTANTLTTKHLTLRQPNGGDWVAYRDFFLSDRSVTLGGPDDLAKAWRIFAAQVGQWSIHGFGMWVITLQNDDTALGMAGAWFPADWPEKEIGWVIFDPNFEGKGIAREAARAAVDYAYLSLGWQTAVSYISPDNRRSIALAESLGAALDTDAACPRPESPCLVYRHPKPKGLT